MVRVKRPVWMRPVGPQRVDWPVLGPVPGPNIFARRLEFWCRHILGCVVDVIQGLEKDFVSAHAWRSFIDAALGGAGMMETT